MIAAVRSSAVLLAVCVLCTSLSPASGMMVQRWNFATANCTGPYAVADLAALGQCQGSSPDFFAYSSCDASLLYQYQHLGDATCAPSSREMASQSTETYTCRVVASGSYLLACEGIPRPSADSAGASTGDDHSDVATSSGADDGDAHSDGSSSGADDDHTNTYTSSGNDGGASSSSTGPCEDFECAAAAMAPSAILVAALIATVRAAL